MISFTFCEFRCFSAEIEFRNEKESIWRRASLNASSIITTFLKHILPSTSTTSCSDWIITCSFLVFFLGTGSLPRSDSDLLLTDRRCSFLSWEPENTSTVVTFHEPRCVNPSPHVVIVSVVADLADCCGVMRETRSAGPLPPRSSDLRGSLPSFLPLPPLYHRLPLPQDWTLV